MTNHASQAEVHSVERADFDEILNHLSISRSQQNDSATAREARTYVLHFAIVRWVRNMTRIERHSAEEVVRAGENRHSEEEICNGVSRNCQSIKTSTLIRDEK